MIRCSATSCRISEVCTKRAATTSWPPSGVGRRSSFPPEVNLVLAELVVDVEAEGLSRKVT